MGHDRGRSPAGLHRPFAPVIFLRGLRLTHRGEGDGEPAGLLDEGEQQVIAKVTEGQAAALSSERDDPKRIAVGAPGDEDAGKISRAA